MTLDQTVDQMAFDLLSRGQPIRFIARGRSMWPNIIDGDEVRIDPLWRSPMVGDVALITGDGGVLLHRIVATSMDGAFVTQGDSLPQRDGAYQKRQVVGLLGGVTRNGRPIRVSKQPSVILVSQFWSALRHVFHRINHRQLGS